MMKTPFFLSKLTIFRISGTRPNNGVIIAALTLELTGSILKELNAFIKQSVDFLRYREAEKAFDEKHDEEEALEEIDAMELPDIPEDLKFPEYTG